MPERYIIHVDMDAFFAAIEQRDNPALKGRPVIIGADPKGGRGRGVVSTCSYEARKYGVKSAKAPFTAPAAGKKYDIMNYSDLLVANWN